MKQAVLKAWDLPALSVSALVLFVVCFAIYTWWAYRKENKAVFEKAALIPLEDAPTSNGKRESV